MFYQAMVKALGASGFGVEQNRAAAAAVCAVQVEEGMQQRDSGVFFYPALTATISGKAGPLFSFKVETERRGAVNPGIAKRRGYTDLASALEGSLTSYTACQRLYMARPGILLMLYYCRSRYFR